MLPSERLLLVAYQFLDALQLKISATLQFNDQITLIAIIGEYCVDLKWKISKEFAVCILPGDIWIPVYEPRGGASHICSYALN